MFLYSVPGIVEFYVNDLAASEAEVSWSTPLQPNGIITSYQVIYSVYGSSTTISSKLLSDTTNTYIIRNLGILILGEWQMPSIYHFVIVFLEPGIPYQVTVVAFTSAGRGALNDYIVFFSEELIPRRFPADINYTRVNQISINVTWAPLSLFEAQGFPLYQVVLSQSSRNSGTSSATITTNNTFAIFNVTADQQYSLVVGVTTGNDRSAFVYSNPITGTYVAIIVNVHILIHISAIVINYHITVSRLAGGTGIIGGAIGRIMLIAIVTVIIF